MRIPSTLYTSVETSGKNRAPWKLHNQAGKGEAFTDEQVEGLSKKFDFEPHVLKELSRQVHRILYRELRKFQPEQFVSRVDKAKTEIQRAVERIQIAEQELAATKELVSNIHFGDISPTLQKPEPSDLHIRYLEGAFESLEHLKSHLKEMAVKRRVIYQNNPDRRRARDLRRQSICNCIFELWREEGRSISYTSNPTKSERSGQLIEFINDVVFLSTAPPTRLSTETIKSEITQWKSSEPDGRSA
tara:strand:+ start:13727 stop:14461 length:735 start_codon:yes stop_codon:yes gene_type:complete